MTQAEHPQTAEGRPLMSILEQYRPQITEKVWAEARPSVRIADEVAAVIGDRTPDSFRDNAEREWVGPSWLEEKSEARLFMVRTWFEEYRRERHKRYFRWNTEPKVGCWVWIDDGPALVRRLTVEEAERWDATR